MVKKNLVGKQGGERVSRPEKKAPSAREMRQIVRQIQQSSSESSDESAGEEDNSGEEEEEEEEEGEDFEQQSSSGESSGAYVTDDDENDNEDNDVMDQAAQSQLRNIEKQTRSWSLKDSSRRRLTPAEG
eukprot:gene44416-54317_t